MEAALKSPFDPYVSQIMANPQYLSPQNATDIVGAVKKVFPALIANPEGKKSTASPQDLLASTIESLGETIQKMNIAAATGEGGLNTADLKKIVDAQEKQIRILARLSEVLTANERQSALENALIEAMDEMPDKNFKESYLAKLHVKLGQNSRKLGNMASL